MPPPPDPGACQGRPPHTTPVRGWFAGPVYLAPLSTWRRDATVVKWPPSPVTEPSLAPWDAVLDQGTLVLTRGGVDGVPPTKVGIPLEGCSGADKAGGRGGCTATVQGGGPGWVQGGWSAGPHMMLSCSHTTAACPGPSLPRP